MNYAKIFNRRTTPQSAPIPGSNQTRNHAGGYAWEVGPWAVLDRFLILGSEGGTFYVTPQKLTYENAENVLELIRLDGSRVIQRVVEISVAGRAPKNDPAVFVLALCASFGDDKVRAEALLALPTVCRTGTHLFQFAAACDGMRGWGRGLRRAVGNWYNAKPAEELELQLVKYQQRDGWSNRDLLRLAHPVPATETHRALYKWVVDDEIGEPVPGVAMPRVEAIRRLKDVTHGREAAAIISEARLPRETVPTELLKLPEVWEALLEGMPITAMVRNLATMTRVGLLKGGSQAAKDVVNRLRDAERIKRARVHPMALLMALRTYTSGKGVRSDATWKPLSSVIDALDEAYYLAFANVQPTGKRYLLGVDVSGSMGSWTVANSPLTCAEAATAMAMVTVATENDVTPMAFADTFRSLPLSRRMRLDQALRHTQNQAFGATDCSLPMQYALKDRQEVDVFVVYTDNETWFGHVHPAQALREYRERMGIDAKLIVVGMTATKFSIADPNDPGMLDVVGFDTAVPEVMAAFVT